jgi:effector-binding domain-containing protein
MSENAYAIRLETIGEVPLAVIEDEAYAQNIGPKIMAASSRLYPKLRELGIKGLGKDVVVYHPGSAMLWNEPPGIRIEVGVQLQEPLTDASDPVHPSRTPGGRVATTLHRGPYQGLPAAHMAIHTYCGQHGLKLGGRNWEVYGQHDEADPSKLETQVFYELA